MAPGDGARHGNIATKIDIAREGRLNRVRNAQQCFFPILAKRMGFRDVRNVNQGSYRSVSLVSLTG